MDNPTEARLDDLTNWLEGIGVAMINLLDDTQLTALARADWNESMKILEKHSDRSDREGARMAYATMLGALIQSPYAVQQVLETLHRQMMAADPKVKHTARWSPFQPARYKDFVARAVVNHEVRERIRHEFVLDLVSRLGKLTHEMNQDDHR